MTNPTLHSHTHCQVELADTRTMSVSILPNRQKNKQRRHNNAYKKLLNYVK